VHAITPLAVPAGAGALLYGGTFDPPHVAHIDLALAARDALARATGAPWRLVYVPAARSPHKEAGPVATGAQRVAMLEAALEGAPGAVIWTDELDRASAGEPSYWINTVRRARDALGPGAPLRFLIGADQAVEFHRWREARAIIALAAPAVLARAEIDTPAALAGAMARSGFWTEAELGAWAGWLVDVGALAAASTAARRGEPTPLPEPVAAYIRRHGLY
jgi:nicotinate-nucleotide adenylyltransferase